MAATDGSDGAFRRVFRNPDLRRVNLSLGAIVLGSTCYQIALGIVAIKDRGAGGVGIAYAVQILPLALVSPFSSVLADRWQRRRLMVAIDVVRFACTGANAIAVAGGASLWVVLALGAPGAVASTAYGPAARAVMPSLVSDPEDLTAANVAQSGIAKAATLGGPALAGILVALGDAQLVFAAGALLFLTSGLLVARLSGGNERPERRADAGSRLGELSAGVRVVIGSQAIRRLVGVDAVQNLVAGVLNVVVVVLAIETLDMGKSGVGVLYAAIGVGGILGSVAAAGLAGRRSLTGTLAFGVLLWSIPPVCIGLATSKAVALIGLAVMGLSEVFVEVAAVTLLQRSVADDVLGRVFGVLQAYVVAMAGIGALIAPPLIDNLHVRWTLVVIGGVLVVQVALMWTRLRRIDAAAPAPTAAVALLRRLPMFEALPPATLETLAGHLRPVTVAAGATVVRAGEAGDRFFVIEDGRVEVLIDGAHVRFQGPGEGFGEIALLRGTRRTATVVARAPTTLRALDGDVFVSAVTGHPTSARAADAVIARWLERPVALAAAT